VRNYRNQPAGTVARARKLRRDATDAERHLLRALRQGVPHYKWRRQVPVGPYFADLLCFSERLVIEVDGGQHSEATVYDAARTRFIEREGYRVVRFWNHDVLANVEGVLTQISLSLGEREGAAKLRKGEGDYSAAPSPRAASRLAPLPAGEG